MIVDPIQSAIAAYKGIDDVFRQDRLDEERRQQQGFQNNLALSQDQRAQESHQLLKDKADKQQKLADVQSLRHRAATKSLTDEDLTIMKQDPYLKKFFEDTSLIDAHLAAVGQIHVFWLSENRTFGPFVINHHKRREVHAKETSQLHAGRKSHHLETSPYRAGSYIRPV
jgi:hypothetical protein